MNAIPDRFAQARAELDWQPTHPSLVEEFRNGSYRTSTR